LQEMLVYFDPWIAGVVMPSIIMVGLMVFPCVDSNPLGNGYYTLRQRRFALWQLGAGFLPCILLIVIGTFIRGPGWIWFWPGQTWDHNLLVFEANRDLPDIFHITSALAKGMFGAIVICMYVFLAAIGFHKLFTLNSFNRKIYKRMSLIQYLTLQFFLITMMLLPVKIFLRLVLRIKYVWITPWFNI